MATSTGTFTSGVGAVALIDSFTVDDKILWPRSLWSWPHGRHELLGSRPCHHLCRRGRCPSECAAVSPHFAVTLDVKTEVKDYFAYSGHAHFGVGLAVGMNSLAAGLAINIVGEAGVRASAQQPRLISPLIINGKAEAKDYSTYYATITES